MNKTLSIPVLTCVVVLMAPAASAEVVFTDAIGDEGTGNSNLDLTSVAIDNDATTLTIAVTVENLHSDWGKYMIFFDTGVPGQTGNNNPWNRNIDFSGNHISHFFGSWVDAGGGGFFHSFDADSGNWDAGNYIGISVDWSGTNTIFYTFSLADLGVNLGDTFRFDIASTGGNEGDPGTDMFSSGNHGTWGGGSTLGGDLLEYYVVPAPGTIALLGFAGLFARRRRA